ncbi:hypothetical protein AaE_001203, partial [Aphanomyces astaci]
VLRCFPHCCPEHTESPFCASSLGVDVAGSVKFLQQAIVLLHFEASYEPAIDCGDLLDAHHIESSLRTDSNPRGEWIPTDAVAIHVSWMTTSSSSTTSTLRKGGTIGGWVGRLPSNGAAGTASRSLAS